MNYDFAGKSFKVVRNDGPDAEVNEETVFHFKQNGNVIHADYYGGQVKVGKFIGVLKKDVIEFRYVQVNIHDEFHTGHSKDIIQLTDSGKIRLIDEWEWESKAGKGLCILEEI